MSPFILLLLPVVLSLPISQYDKNKLLSDVSSGRGLYFGFNEVYNLNATNFKSTVFNTSNPKSWLVQFYNSWCGHCQRFASNYKKLALDIYRWRDLVQVAAVNCHDSINIALCREYEIDYYPFIKYFPKNSTNDFLGTQVLSRIVNLLRQTVLKFLIEYKEFNMDQYEGNWRDLKDTSLLVVEEKNSSLGQELALDLISIKDQLTVVSINPSNFENKVSIPSFYLIKNGASEFLNFSTSNRSEFVQSVYNYLVPLYIYLEKPKDVLPHVSEISAPELHEVLMLQEKIRKRMQSNASLSDIVFQVDIEGAIKQALHSEIPRIKTIKGQKMSALKNFLQVLNDYFPTGRKGKEYFACILKYVNALSISGTDFELGLNKCEKDGIYMPSGSPPWLGCRGSQLTYRGYPCSLWMTFHTLTVQADIHNDPDPTRVLTSITGYVKEFFGCTECSEHFQEMAKTIQNNVTDGKSSVLWLWKAHNSVNKRLAGDATEDPIHYKVQFPTTESCPKCFDGNWNENQVYDFIKHMYYNISFIVIDELQSEEKKVQTRSIKQEVYDDFTFQPKKSDNFSFYLTPIDISLCALLYLVSMGIIILVCAKFYKQTHRKKNYLLDCFQKV